jgi:2,4-dienoyl-CoA reductase-like NADH-dependent reductase (Old Yellow Enzyme family)
MELRNRIVMAPMGTRYAEEGFVTEQQKNYYAARAKGGVGLIVTKDSGADTSPRFYLTIRYHYTPPVETMETIETKKQQMSQNCHKIGGPEPVVLPFF